MEYGYGYELALARSKAEEATRHLAVLEAQQAVDAKPFVLTYGEWRDVNDRIEEAFKRVGTKNGILKDDVMNLRNDLIQLRDRFVSLEAHVLGSDK